MHTVSGLLCLKGFYLVVWFLVCYVMGFKDFMHFCCWLDFLVGLSGGINFSRSLRQSQSLSLFYCRCYGRQNVGN